MTPVTGSLGNGSASARENPAEGWAAGTYRSGERKNRRIKINRMKVHDNDFNLTLLRDLFAEKDQATEYVIDGPYQKLAFPSAKADAASAVDSSACFSRNRSDPGAAMRV
jgi:hypothetical protein